MKKTTQQTAKKILKGAATASIATIGAIFSLALLQPFMTKKVDELVEGSKKEEEQENMNY